MTTYLITGVNRGIGAALLVGATARGHAVIGTTRDGQDGTVPLNLDDPARIAAQLADIPPIDVLINNAGVIGPEAENQTPLNMDWDGFAHTLSVNTIAPLAVAQAALPRLRESKVPMILTVSSQMAWMGYRKPTQIAYRASKSAEQSNAGPRHTTGTGWDSCRRCGSGLGPHGHGRDGRRGRPKRGRRWHP